MIEKFQNYCLYDILNSPHEELIDGFLANCPYDSELFSRINIGDVKFANEVSKYLTKAKNTVIGYNTPEYSYRSLFGRFIYREDVHVLTINSQAKPKNIFTTSSRIAITHFYRNPTLSKGITRYISRVAYTDYNEFMDAKEKSLNKSTIPDYPFKEIQRDANSMYCDGGNIRYHVFFDYNTGKDGIIGMVKTNWWSIYSYYGLVILPE